MPLNFIQLLQGHTNRVWTLAWNPSGTILASSGGDKTIRLWAKRGEKWDCISILKETHNKSIRRVCWSPCGRYLASASFDSTVCIWQRDLSDGTWATLVNLEGHESEVKSVSWSHDGRYLASCGRDRTVWIWERATSDEEVGGDVGEESAENWDCSDVKNDHSKDVKHIVWHPYHNILVSCSYDDSIKFFHKDDEDWKCYETLTSHTSTVWSADFSSSGEFLVTCSDDKTVRIWRNHAHDKLPAVESHSWKCVSVIQGYHSRTIYDVSWNKSNDMIVSASGDNSLAFYCRSTQNLADQDIFTCIEKFSNSHDCDVNSVAWNPTIPDLLVSGCDDGTIKLWNYSSSDKEKGMKALTVVEDIMRSLARSSLLTDNSKEPVKNSASESSIIITDFPNLLNLIKSLQELQNELVNDEEKQLLEKLFDLKISNSNSRPIELNNMRIDETDGSVNEFSIDVGDSCGNIRHIFKITIDKEKFRLHLPRRSVKFLTLANELFLLEKTGDMFRVSKSGESQFLLGHLFMFSDVAFIIETGGNSISYVVSADRDEKIRLSCYPEAHKIERFCFGHKHFVRRLLSVSEHKFISIDQGNYVCLWNLKDLDTSVESKPLMPEQTIMLGESALKKICVR